MKASCSWASLDLEMDLNIWSVNSISISQKLGDLALLSLMAADPETWRLTMISTAITLAEPSNCSGPGFSAFLLLPERTLVHVLNPKPFSVSAVELCPALGQPEPETTCQLLYHGWGLHPERLRSFSATSASSYPFSFRLCSHLTPAGN